MKQMMNSPSDNRIKIHLNRDAEECLRDLAGVLPTRNGKPMRYVHIVYLALYNLASQMDVDTVPYLCLLSTALRDIDKNFGELEVLKQEYADKILADTDLQDLVRALETAHEVCGACEAEVQRQALASCSEATFPLEDDCEG